MKFETKTIHAGVSPEKNTGAIMTPIFQTSTYVQSEPGIHKGYEYSRTHNPTREVLQVSIASLENGKYGLCFASGLAAIDAVIKLFKPGDEIIASSDLYGGTYRLFTRIFEKFGLKFHFIDMEEPLNLINLINSNTKLIWIETPTNPMLNIIDIETISQISKTNNILLAVDNTFATPYLQRPLELGADIVMHSVTKYLAGHSDVIMGGLVVNHTELAERLAFVQNSSGAVPAPQDCFLVLRGIKTLHLRMQRHCENAEKVAKYLIKHPMVDKVYWPGFSHHTNHDVASRQMKDYGGMISFTIKNCDTKGCFDRLKNFKLFSLAESLGGVESMVNHPATMTHASVPYEQRQKLGIVDSLIRLSVGIENIDDLLTDVDNALK